jgi:hypothetical protein
VCPSPALVFVTFVVQQIDFLPLIFMKGNWYSEMRIGVRHSKAASQRVWMGVLDNGANASFLSVCALGSSEKVK